MEPEPADALSAFSGSAVRVSLNRWEVYRSRSRVCAMAMARPLIPFDVCPSLAHSQRDVVLTGSDVSSTVVLLRPADIY